MKTRSFGLLILIVAIGVFLSGCGCFMQAQKGEEAPPPPPAAKVEPPAVKQEIPVTPPPPPPAPVVMNDAYFDFDKYNIRAGDGEILKQDAGWFKANPGKKARIEGHCDERGTVEYNLVLGQKRADATKKYLQDLGVDGKLMETVSYGKERPVDRGHNEAAWAKNRRAHIQPLP
jgi:peptidoglycan-associated lipoprotein